MKACITNADSPAFKPVKVEVTLHTPQEAKSFAQLLEHARMSHPGASPGMDWDTLKAIAADLRAKSMLKDC